MVRPARGEHRGIAVPLSGLFCKKMKIRCPNPTRFFVIKDEEVGYFLSKGGLGVKRLAAIALGVVTAASSFFCGTPAHQREKTASYFFLGQVLEEREQRLLVKVCSPGNSGLRQDTVIEVAFASEPTAFCLPTDKVRVLMTKNGGDAADWHPAVFTLR